MTGGPCALGYLAAGRATQGGQWGPVQDSYPIHLNPICGARSNSSAADVAPSNVVMNAVPGFLFAVRFRQRPKSRSKDAGERGNTSNTQSSPRGDRFHTTHITGPHSPSLTPVCRPHAIVSQLTVHSRASPRGASPVCRPHARHSSQVTAEPLPFVDHARCSASGPTTFGKKHQLASTLGDPIRETFPTRPSPP